MSKYTRKPVAVPGTDVRYGGRTLKFDVYINTDAEGKALGDRMRAVERAARGPFLDMVVVALSEVPADDAEGLWAAVKQKTEEANKS